MTIRDAQEYIGRNLKDNADLIDIRINDDSIIDDRMGDYPLAFDVFVNDKLYANRLMEDEVYNTVVFLVDGYNLGRRT